MLIIRTKLSFIKKHKKTKTGKKVYKKKYFRTLYNNDIPMGMITSVSITRGCKPIEKTMFDENTPGWNQDIQDVFKKYPPIPIENIEISMPTEQLQSYGIRLFKGDEHETLTSTSRRIANMTIEERLEEAKKWEVDNFYPHKVQAVYQGSKNILNDNNLPEGFNITIETESEKDTLGKIISKVYNHNFTVQVEKDEPFGVVPKIHKSISDRMFYKMKNSDILISLDWDDVIYDLMKKNIEFINNHYGVSDVHLEITDYYYLYKTYPKIADELWNHPENYITADLVAGAKKFYNDLVNLVGEHRIQIVTSTMENVIPIKDKMIKEKFGINCKIIHSIFGKYKKHEFTKNTLLIDDFVGNIRDHFIHNQNYGIVFNHMNLEYIRKECESEGYLHVTTYEGVLEKVKIYLEVLDNLELQNNS